jgi:diguanylate cyclase (GGDEF)-like protein
MAHRPIELGLSLPDRTRDRRLLLPLVAELLALLGEASLDSELLGTEAFRHEVEQFPPRLEDAAADAKRLEAAAGECATYCQQFVSRLQAHVQEREAEFSDLVTVVEQLVASAHGDAEHLDAQLTGSSDRLTRIVELDDLRILKRRLSLELTTLRRVIEEQRTQHAAQRQQLASEVARLQRRLARTREGASLDPLTRVANRGRFDRTLRRWMAMHRRSGEPFALAMLDLDDLKLVNDTWGHQAGDAVLVHVGRVLTRHLRSSDVVARYGGDEFAAIVSGAGVAIAEERVGEALADLRERPLQLPGADTLFTVTFSGGLTEFAVQDTPVDIVGRADRALYDAKWAGSGCLRRLLRPPTSKLFRNGRPIAQAG